MVGLARPQTAARLVELSIRVGEKVKYARTKDWRSEHDIQEDRFVDELYPYVMEVFGNEGWDGLDMDVYNELDPRKPTAADRR